MADSIEKVLVPDLGDAEQVDVIEILVKPGDKVNKGDSLLTLEGDKATMDVPSPQAGEVEKISVNINDKVGTGDLVLTLKTANEKAANKLEETSKPAAKKSQASKQKLVIPDLGDEASVEVIELEVKVGDSVGKGDALLTLEGDKATMDVPSLYAGKITKLTAKVGNKVSTGDVIGEIETTDAVEQVAPATAQTPVAETAAQTTVMDDDEQAPREQKEYTTGEVHAGPGVRRIGNEFGIDLIKVKATGPRGRILKVDVQNYVKTLVRQAESGGGLGLPAMPKIDFSKFGEIETKPLSKIKKATANNMRRNWLTVPSVTQFELADVTDLEAFRKDQKTLAAKQNIRLTPIAFIIKAVEFCLKKYPMFNASLDPSGENLIYKKYFNIGVAVDTPNGLVVPVIKDVNNKELFEIAKELGELSEKARGPGLSMADMQGGCFTISSLGGIGGTSFTPIVNAPEVAILGVSRMEKRPVYDADGNLSPRLMLPLSLTYDHRVIDGADGARFAVHLAQTLADIRTILL